MLGSPTECRQVWESASLRTIQSTKKPQFGVHLAADHGPKRSNSSRLAGGCLTTFSTRERASRDAQGYNVCHLMPHFLKPIILWIVDALPDISNLILVLVGVIMSLPKLAEKIEDYAIARYTLAIGCIVLGLAGFIVGVNQRRQATSQMTTLGGNVNILVTNTNSLVTSTNNVVTMVGVMLPQVAVLNSRIADLDRQIAAAKGKPQAIASLQAQVAAAREQSSKISKQLLFTMVPGISNELDGVSERWSAEVDQQKSHAGSSQMAHLSSKWSNQARPSIITAESLRQQLLQELPPSDQKPEDTSEAAVFARAIKGGSPDDLRTAARYLRDLSNRVAAAASPKPDHGGSQYEKLSNDHLIGAAKEIAEQIGSYSGKWRYQINVEIGASYDNQRAQRPLPPSEERIARLWKEEAETRERVNQQYATNSKDLFARADDLRGVCVDRLKKKGGQLPPDGKIDDLFKRLATVGIDSPFGSDSDKVPVYLLDLCNRLKP